MVKNLLFIINYTLYFYKFLQLYKSVQFYTKNRIFLIRTYTSNNIINKNNTSLYYSIIKRSVYIS
ncbi:hypothetical protein Q7M_1261 (plasmid) [Borrelia crocidurae str. Achema]|uniref:Uncharacterized protein n=1 Tax=Borrelia crocidurae (strain Achema) TaxID=1155096 RepID=I0FEW2_BORCA|nr:hypothetical protein Q7M_1261 [Borrelia crocidurae str. Achema]